MCSFCWIFFIDVLIHSAGFSSVVFCFMLFDERFARTLFLREPCFCANLFSPASYRYVVVGASSVMWEQLPFTTHGKEQLPLMTVVWVHPIDQRTINVHDGGGIQIQNCSFPLGWKSTYRRISRNTTVFLVVQ